jgi:hypothetical protein
MSAVLLLDERILADGRHARTWAELDGQKIEIRDEEGGVTAALSIAAVAKVMERYGRALEPGIPLTGEVLELGAGRRLRRLRYHAAVDATGRDYLVWEEGEREPLAAVATMVTAALRYLALRLSEDRGSDPSGI